MPGKICEQQGPSDSVILMPVSVSVKSDSGLPVVSVFEIGDKILIPCVCG